MSKLSEQSAISEYFTWKSAARTDVGCVRKVNEDALMSNQDEAHWVVADGMGGHNAGDVASSEICGALAHLKQTDDFPAFIDNIESSIVQVNQMLVEMAEKENGLIGSTVVGMAFNQKHIVSYWAGDSRNYLFRSNRLKQITIDHTAVQEMVEANLISPEEVNTHPEKNIITRAVGSDSKIFVDFSIDEVQDGDLYVVCSDGVEKEMSDEELENLLLNADGSLDETVNEIVDLVLERGARDNVSVILIQFSSNKSGG